MRTSAFGTLPSLGAMPGRAAVRVPWAGADRGLPGSSHLTGTAVRRRRWCPAGCAAPRWPDPGTGRRSHGSPAVAGQDPLPQLIGGQPTGRYLGEQRQVLRAWLQALGPHRGQRRRDRVLPLGGLLQRFVLLPTQVPPPPCGGGAETSGHAAHAGLQCWYLTAWYGCTPAVGSEENQTVCGG